MRRQIWRRLILAVVLAVASPALAAVTLTPTEPGATHAPNPAGIAIELSTGNSVETGSRVIFIVSVRKPGYLILLDVDPEGKVQQIFPNLQSMQMPVGAGDSANFVKPGRPAKIPDPTNPVANFEFVVEPPLGGGMVVALLSPHLVQLVDLPEIPPEMIGTPAAVDFLYDAAKALKISVRGTTEKLVDPDWSLAAQFYNIK